MYRVITWWPDGTLMTMERIPDRATAQQRAVLLAAKGLTVRLYTPSGQEMSY